MDSSKFLHMKVRKEAGVIDPEYGDTEGVQISRTEVILFIYLFIICTNKRCYLIG